MSKKRYVVRLSKSEREDLSALIRRGKRKVSALRRCHARVLLEVDQGKHGPSWSDVRTGEALEIELQVLSGLCLDRRIGARAKLEREVRAWTSQRNASIIGVDWQFTAKDARIKLKRLYPEFQALTDQQAGSAANILSRP